MFAQRRDETRKSPIQGRLAAACWSFPGRISARPDTARNPAGCDAGRQSISQSRPALHQRGLVSSACSKQLYRTCNAESLDYKGFETWLGCSHTADVREKSAVIHLDMNQKDPLEHDNKH